MLKYVALSFIAQNTCFYLFAVELKFSLIEQKKVFHPVCSESLLVSLGFERNNVFVGFRTLNAHFRYEKKGRDCSGKRITENSVTYPKINRNVVLSKIK